jgi:hypothetical protein
MLSISKEQVDYFARGVRSLYEERLAVWLLDEHGEYFEELSDDDARAWVHCAVVKASECGMVQELETTQFVVILLAWGEVIYADPTVKEILTTQGLIPIGKVRRLMECFRGSDPAAADAVALPALWEDV